MATLTPQGQTAPGHRAGSVRHSHTATRRPTSTIEVLRWLRSMLDRPLTSYHLVLGSVALLLIEPAGTPNTGNAATAAPRRVI